MSSVAVQWDLLGLARGMGSGPRSPLRKLVLWQVGLSEGPARATRGPQVRSPVLAKVSLEEGARLLETGPAWSGAWAFSDSGPFSWGHTLVQAASLRASGSQEASLGQGHPLLLKVSAARDQ